jgi:LPS sulfotransferase NodH
MKPSISYMVCGTPRCGSTLLCEALKITGIAGFPDEYFFWDFEPRYYKAWDVSSYEEYLNKAIELSTTPNGVMGVKIMMIYFRDVVRKLRELPEYKGRQITTPELMASVFPNLHYIWITRRNKVRQAVSWWIAHQTGIWVWDGEEQPGPSEKPVFNFKAIDYLVQLIVTHEAGWQEYYSDCGITPFVVVYEDFVKSYEKTALRIVKFLNVSVPPDLVFGKRSMKKQATETSEKWVRQYNDIKAEMKQEVANTPIFFE